MLLNPQIRSWMSGAYTLLGIYGYTVTARVLSFRTWLTNRSEEAYGVLREAHASERPIQSGIRAHPLRLCVAWHGLPGLLQLHDYSLYLNSEAIYQQLWTERINPFLFASTGERDRGCAQRAKVGRQVAASVITAAESLTTLEVPKNVASTVQEVSTVTYRHHNHSTRHHRTLHGLLQILLTGSS